MNVKLQTQGFALTPGIGSRVHERVDKALDRYSEDIVSVDVFLKDVNGPKGGDELNLLSPDNIHVQQVMKASDGTRTGIGALEQIVIGPYAPAGFTGLLDGAS